MEKKRVNTSDNIYYKFKEQFIDGTLDFGEKISEIDYCKLLNVSRTPLREAIKKLEIEGLIERELNGRIKIMEINTKRIEEIFLIRNNLEGIIISNVIDSPKHDEIVEALKQNVFLTNHYMEAGNISKVKELFVEFNEILYENSELEFTIKILRLYYIITRRLRKNSLETNSRLTKAFKEHVSIMKAIEKKDLSLALKLNEKHVNSAKENILLFFKESIV